MERYTVRITTGAVVEQDGKILVVKELETKRYPNARVVINQPGGHIEKDETVIEALIRETKEETGYSIEPTELIGIYHVHFEKYDVIKFSFVAKLTSEKVTPIIEEDILEAVWMPIDELKNNKDQYRPAIASGTFDDYFAGKRFSLETLHFFDNTRIS
ncbi:NUDIX domain-containing protein [Patescibacteria group bacterium]